MESNNIENNNEDKKGIVTCFGTNVEKAASRYIFDCTENWFAMRVDLNKELLIRDFLSNKYHYRRGIPESIFESGEYKDEVWDSKREKDKIVESYVATQFVHKIYTDRNVWREKVLVPGVVFVKVKNGERKDKIFSRDEINSYIKFFVAKKGTHQADPIPEEQMKLFMAFIENNVEMIDFTNIEKEELPQPEQPMDNSIVGRHVRITGYNGLLKAVRYRNTFVRDKDGLILPDFEGNPRIETKVEVELELNSDLTKKFLVLQSQVEFLD